MPAKKRVERDPVPGEFPSLEAAAEFWDTHDLTDYLDLWKPVDDYSCKIEEEAHLVAIEPSLARRLRQAARKRGISSEALANLWLSERLNNIDKE